MWKIFNVTSGEEYKVPGNKETCINNDNIYESTFILPPDPVTIVAQCEERKVLSSRTTIEYYSEYIVIHVEPPLVASGEFTVYIIVYTMVAHIYKGPPYAYLA